MQTLKELKPGNVYNLFSHRYNVTNRVRLVSFDTTELDRDIAYFQYADRGIKPINADQLKAMFDADIYPPTFALWQWELGKGYSITEN